MRHTVRPLSLSAAPQLRRAVDRRAGPLNIPPPCHRDPARPRPPPPAPARRGSFEVFVDGRYLAASKLAAHAFPDFSRVAGEIVEYAATGAVPPTWRDGHTPAKGWGGVEALNAGGLF